MKQTLRDAWPQLVTVAVVLIAWGDHRARLVNLERDMQVIRDALIERGIDSFRGPAYRPGKDGEARHETEGRLFAAAPVFIVSWIVGFVVRGLVF